MSKINELIGNSRRDLVLKTAGSIKVLVGDKYYNLNFRSEEQEQEDKNEKVTSNFIVTSNINDYENGVLDFPGDGKVIFTLDGNIYYTKNYKYNKYNATSSVTSSSSKDFESTVNFNGSLPFTVKTGELIQNLNAQYLNGKKDTDFLTDNSNPVFNDIKFNNLYSIDGGIKYEDGKFVFNKSEYEYISNTIKIGNTEIIDIKELQYSKIIPYKNTLFVEIIDALYDLGLRFSYAKELIDILNCNDFNWDWLDNDNIKENYDALIDISDYIYCKIKNPDKWLEHSLETIRDRYCIDQEINGASYVFSVYDTNQFNVGDKLNCEVTTTIYKPSDDSELFTNNRCEAEDNQWIEYEETKTVNCIVTSIYNNTVSVTTDFKSNLFTHQLSEVYQETFLGNTINISTNFEPDDESFNYNCLENEEVVISLDSDIIGNLSGDKCDNMYLSGYGIKIVDNSYLINPYIRKSIKYKNLDSDYELEAPKITEYSILSNGHSVILPEPKLNGLIINIYTNDNMSLKNGDEVSEVAANSFVSYRIIPVSPTDYKWIKI